MVLPPVKPRTLAVLLLVPGLHALAREVDSALGLVVGSGLQRPLVGTSLVGILWGRMGSIGVGVGLWLLVVAATVAALAFLRARSKCAGVAEGVDPRPERVALGVSRAAWAEALDSEVCTVLPLLLRPLITLLAVGSVLVTPAYPYAFTLPVGLSQDLGIAQDALALATILALRLGPLPRASLRLSAPGGGVVFFVTALVYGATVPDWALRWEGHPGNEPKYLRQAVALGHQLSFDAEGVSAEMERLPAIPILEAIPRALGVVVRETGLLLSAGPSALDRQSIRATKITRQTIRGKDGGVYYVLAPGPSLLLAPTLRMDRALNLARGEEGRVAVSVLGFALLGAALVAVLFLLARDATGQPGLSAAVAFGFALTPPFVFFYYQFYPEMPGALALALLFRALAFGKPWRGAPGLGLGLVLAFLPWLHQKFLPVFGVLIVTAAFVAWRDRWSRSGWWLLLTPQVVSGLLTLFYNFGVTGCARPDALYLAWGPAGVTTERMGQGILGLLLDARFGILPYAPVFALALAGLLLGGSAVKRLAVIFPAALVYYATVASADNWAGAVCNLGRYFMPVAPVFVVLVALAVAKVRSRRGAIALVLALVAWTGLFTVALRMDPVAANDSGLLLAKSSFVDGNVYIPNLFIRHWSDGSPGLAVRTAVFSVGILLLSLALVRARRAEGLGSPLAAAGGALAFVFVAGFVLERWPTARTAPVFPDALSVGNGVVVRVLGPALVREDRAELRAGSTEVLVRRPAEVSDVTLLTGGDGRLDLPGVAPFLLRPRGAFVRVPLPGGERVRGEGEGDVLYSRLSTQAEKGWVLRPAPDSGNPEP